MLVVFHLGSYIKSKLPFLCSDNKVIIMRVWKNVDVIIGPSSRNILYILMSLDKEYPRDLQYSRDRALSWKCH